MHFGPSGWNAGQRPKAKPAQGNALGIERERIQP